MSDFKICFVREEGIGNWYEKSLSYFKICFGKKAGILAGKPFVEDKSLVFDKSKKNAYFRWFVLICTVGVIVFAFIFLVKGTQEVRAVAADVRDGTEVRMD